MCRHAFPPSSLSDRGEYPLYDYFQQVRGVGYSAVWTLSIHDQWRGPALYTKLSRRAGLFYSQPRGFKQIAQTGELKQIQYYHTGPRHGERTGRNKLCIKALVSFSLGQTYTGYDVTLPKATINSWLHRIQMFIFAQLKYDNKLFGDTIVPLAQACITGTVVSFTLVWDDFRVDHV